MIFVNIIGFVFLLGLVILIHELGHYIMAKRAGILCHEFALGMGPILYSKKKGETLFSIRAIPIGGFVSMAGEEVTSEMVKVGREVKLVFGDDERVTHIVLDPADTRYPEAETVMVDFVDLQAKDDGKLYINHHEVRRDAFYVLRNKEMQIAPYDRSFESKTLTERFGTIVAGPVMNFVLALVIFFIASLFVGQPVEANPDIGGISPESPAAFAELEVGDRLIEINGIAVSDWDDIREALRVRDWGEPVDVVFERDGTDMTRTITPRLSFFAYGFSSDPTIDDAVIVGTVGGNTAAANAREQGTDNRFAIRPGDEILAIGYASETMQPVTRWHDVATFMLDNTTGRDTVIEIRRDDDETITKSVMLEPLEHDFLRGQGVEPIQSAIGIGPTYAFDFLAAFPTAARQLGATSMQIFRTIGALFGDSRIGVGDLAGPIGIYDITTQFISQGALDFLVWIGFLSVNLGFINLLPIPALDGGRLVFLGYEAVARRPVNKTVENTLHFIMFVLLITLFVFIAFNDVLRLLN